MWLSRFLLAGPLILALADALLLTSYAFAGNSALNAPGLTNVDSIGGS